MVPVQERVPVGSFLKKDNLDPNDLKNYRLIPNLPFNSKLLENPSAAQQLPVK